MAESAKDISKQNELLKQQVAEEIWLHYFNNVLYEKHLITEQERNRMSNWIDTRRYHNKPKKSREISR